jgi:SAM-dependent methyltransferase
MPLLRRTPEEPELAGRCRPWPVTAALDIDAPRPGGPDMSEVLLDGLHLRQGDRIVEIWPGSGATTREILPMLPRSYRGIARDAACAERLDHSMRKHPDLQALLMRARAEGEYTGFLPGRPDATGLPAESATAVFGECVLTPLTHDEKVAVVTEAARLLPPGGRLGLHELCLTPRPGWNETLDHELAGQVQDDLEAHAGPGLHPLALDQWRDVVEQGGLVVTATRVGEAEPPSITTLLRDEGWRGLMRAAGHGARDWTSVSRLRGLSYCMSHHTEGLGAIVVIAERPLIGDLLMPDA